MALLPVLAGDGRRLSLRLDSTLVQIWGGLFGNPDAGWLSAPADLLWEGARLYVAGRPDPADPSIWLADRIRIVGAPVSVRATLRTFEPLANSVNDGDFLALLGNSGRAGVYLLTRTGLAQPLGVQNARLPGLAQPQMAACWSPPTIWRPAPMSFTWVRTDGTAIQIAAQPFQRIRGIVGDEHSGIWWLETPQARLDQWQLWHYEPQTRRIALRLQTTGPLLPTVPVARAQRRRCWPYDPYGMEISCRV
ncbi:MAG: hypothetical protein R2867_09195 [Caldilineaceae bacterium]